MKRIPVKALLLMTISLFTVNRASTNDILWNTRFEQEGTRDIQMQFVDSDLNQCFFYRTNRVPQSRMFGNSSSGEEYSPNMQMYIEKYDSLGAITQSISVGGHDDFIVQGASTSSDGTRALFGIDQSNSSVVVMRLDESYWFNKVLTFDEWRGKTVVDCEFDSDTLFVAFSDGTFEKRENYYMMTSWFATVWEYKSPYSISSFSRDINGNILLVGYEEKGTLNHYLSNYEYPETSIQLTNLTDSGKINWEKEIDGEFSDIAHDAIFSADSHWVVTGEVNFREESASKAHSEVGVFTLTQNGVLLKSKEHEGIAGRNWGERIFETNDSSFIITGKSSVEKILTRPGTWGNELIMKINGSGDTLSTNFEDVSSNYLHNRSRYSEKIDSSRIALYGSSGTVIYDMDRDSSVHLATPSSSTHYGSASEINDATLFDSLIVTVGYTEEFGRGSSDILVITSDLKGNLVTTNTIGDSLDQNAIAVTSNDSVMVSVGTWGEELWVARLNSEGHAYPSNRFDLGIRPLDIKIVDDGALVLATSGRHDSTALWVIKVNSQADTLWTKKITHDYAVSPTAIEPFGDRIAVTAVMGKEYHNTLFILSSKGELILQKNIQQEVEQLDITREYDRVKTMESRNDTLFIAGRNGVNAPANGFITCLDTNGTELWHQFIENSYEINDLVWTSGDQLAFSMGYNKKGGGTINTATFNVSFCDSTYAHGIMNSVIALGEDDFIITGNTKRYLGSYPAYTKKGVFYMHKFYSSNDPFVFRSQTDSSVPITGITTINGAAPSLKIVQNRAVLSNISSSGALQIYSMNGRLLNNVVLTPLTVSVDLGSLASGCYVSKLTVDGFQSSQQFMIR